MPKAVAACPFCARLAADSAGLRNDVAAAFADGYPVSRGHTLVVPLRHEADFDRLGEAERMGAWRLAHEVCERLRRSHAPDGFNIGVNVGAAAGQTVAHAHIHVIPRYQGDVPDPRGGVRWVLPRAARYW